MTILKLTEAFTHLESARKHTKGSWDFFCFSPHCLHARWSFVYILVLGLIELIRYLLLWYCFNIISVCQCLKYVTWNTTFQKLSFFRRETFIYLFLTDWVHIKHIYTTLKSGFKLFNQTIAVTVAYYSLSAGVKTAKRWNFTDWVTDQEPFISFNFCHSKATCKKVHVLCSCDCLSRWIMNMFTSVFFFFLL